MWAFGRYDLRLSESEFWALTPREYSLLAERCEAQVKWHDLRAALAPWMMNLLWASKKGKVELDDLMVYHMMQKSTTATADPEVKAVALQDRIQNAFEMISGAARK